MTKRWTWRVVTPSLWAPGTVTVQGYERTRRRAWLQVLRHRTRDSVVEVRKVLLP